MIPFKYRNNLLTGIIFRNIGTTNQKYHLIIEDPISKVSVCSKSTDITMVRIQIKKHMQSPEFEI